MKRLALTFVLTLLSGLLAPPIVAAGVPVTINLQGRFTDAAGNNIADGEYTLGFNIYDDTISGHSLWKETHLVQVTDGLYTVLVGTIMAFPADLFSSGANRYLGVTLDPEPELPLIPLSAVAYSYQAQDADAATLALDLTCAGCVSAGEIADEPGVASDAANVSIAMDGTIQDLLARDISIPSSGYVFAIATAQVTIIHTTGTISTIRFGISTTAGVFPDNQDVAIAVAASAPSGTYAQAVTVHGLFADGPGGVDTYRFLGDETGGDVTVSDLQLTLIFFATTYGVVVSTAAPSGGELSSSQNMDTEPILLGLASESIQQASADQPVSTLDLVRMMANFEARIQQLEESMRQAPSGIEEKR